MDARERLDQRPTFEEAETGYLALLGELRATLDAQVPGLRWLAPEPARADKGGCGEPFERVEGAAAGIYTAGEAAEGAVPDERWQPTVDALLVPLREQGFDEVIVLQDEPGAHEVSVGDPETGARVVLGTKVGTILTLYGACFLEADATGS